MFGGGSCTSLRQDIRAAAFVIPPLAFDPAGLRERVPRASQRPRVALCQQPQARAGTVGGNVVEAEAAAVAQVKVVRPFSKNRGKAIVASLAGTMIPASTGLGVASMAKSVPVAGTAIGAALPNFRSVFPIMTFSIIPRN